MLTSENLKFSSEDGHEVWNYRLAEFPTPIQTIIPIFFKLIYISLRYTWFGKQFCCKKIYLFVWINPKLFYDKCFCIFSELKVLLRSEFFLKKKK